MSKKLIAGNWKMNLDIRQSEALAKRLRDYCESHNEANADVLICPTFVSLSVCSSVLKGSSVSLGAQNLYSADSGAFTGEISADMLLSAGCSYVIIGHSERRKYFGETNQSVNVKILKAIEKDLKPIMCVGETLQEREDEIFEAIVSEQVEEGLNGVDPEKLNELSIAYEPVWAIGTGMNATPAQASQMHQFIRGTVGKMFPGFNAGSLRILYGGSVNSSNAKELLTAKGIDGALVGGASLKAEEFSAIISAC